MMMPSIRDHFFKGFMNPYEDWDEFSKNFFEGSHHNTMKTDVKENEDSYELEMELPGYKKEDVNAKLENGYLTIQANHSTEKDKKDKKGNYIRKERYQGSVSRSFYVGEQLKTEDIKAKFENGMLLVTLPKKELIEQAKENFIAIEG